MKSYYHWLKVITSKSTSNVYLFFIVFASVILLYTSYDVIVNNLGPVNTVYFVASGVVDDQASFSFENESLRGQFRWCPSIYYESGYENLDCPGVIAGDKSAIETAKNWTNPCTFSDGEIMNLTSNCMNFKRDFPFYFPEPSAEIDAKFPLAFVVMVAKNAEQIVRLFQAIYRPWNVYCLTYDNDTSPEFKRAMNNIDECYQNIIMPDAFVDVNWAGFSILQTAVNCLEVLNDDGRNSKIDWRYVQILSWNDFPLKTNERMVEIARILNGSQDAELEDGQPERFRQFHKESELDETKKSLKKPLPPGNMIIYKGSMAAVLSREFIKFLFTNPYAKQFYNWSETMWAPEEQFWSTLVHNIHTGVPGGFPGSCLPYYHFDKSKKGYVSRFQIWYDDCAGKLKHGSCVFGLGDLEKLAKAPHLVAHKMYLDFEPAALYCLSELHYNRTFGLVNDTLDLNFYRNLPGVRYHNAEDKNDFEC